MLTQDELRSLATEPLATIGSHSVSHPDFLELDRDTAGREFGDSKRQLESVLGRPVGLFSFPHGAHNNGLVRQAHNLGYQRVFTIEPTRVNPTDPGFVVGRVSVGPDDWPLEFRLKLAGAYRWQTWLRSKHKRVDP